MNKIIFTEWLERRQSISESTEPKVGDKAYFGIHDLMKNDFSCQTNPEKVGEIVDIDPIREKVTVAVSKDPFKMGYHRLESRKDRDRRKKMSKDTDGITLTIPVQNLKDISKISGDEPKLWLVVDRNTKYQQGLNQKLNKYMHADCQDSNDNDVCVDMEPHDEDDLSYMDADIELNPEESDTIGKYQMMNREIVPNLPQPKTPLSQIGWKMHNDSRNYDYF